MTFEDEVVETAVRTLGALLSTRSPSASQLPLMDTDGHLNYHCHRHTLRPVHAQRLAPVVFDKNQGRDNVVPTRQELVHSDAFGLVMTSRNNMNSMFILFILFIPLHGNPRSGENCSSINIENMQPKS